MCPKTLPVSMERLNNARAPGRPLLMVVETVFLLPTLVSGVQPRDKRGQRHVGAPHPPHHRMSCSSSHSPGVRELSAETPQPSPPTPARRPERSPSLSLFSVMGVRHSDVSESLQPHGL